MTIFLAKPDKDRLCKILGLLGSDHDGERAAAGAMAHRFIKERNLQWADVVGVTTTPPSRYREPPPASGEPWRRQVQQCLAWRDASAWERSFLLSIARRPFLSEKQRTVLSRIVAAMRMAEAHR